MLYRCCVSISGSQSEAEGGPTSALSKHGDRHAGQSKNSQECSLLEAKEALWKQLARRRGLAFSAPPGEEGLEWESAGFSLMVSGSGFRVLILELMMFQDSRFNVLQGSAPIPSAWGPDHPVLVSGPFPFPVLGPVPNPA